MTRFVDHQKEEDLSVADPRRSKYSEILVSASRAKYSLEEPRGAPEVPQIQRDGTSDFILRLESILHGEDEVAEMIKKVKSRGYYPYRTSQDEIAELSARPGRIDELFAAEVLKTAGQWLAYADEKLEGAGIRCYVAPGNDDMFELDDLIRTSKHVRLAEGQVIELDDRHEMISSGWSNFTPWHTFREEEEEGLRARYEAMIAQLKDVKNSVFNIHVPPYASTLDSAPELTQDLRPKYAGQSLVPVGSHGPESRRKVHFRRVG